ncbi:protein kinase domain-containing protein [Streptomyces sp. L7]
MELVAGRSLERIMAEDHGPVGPREAARIGLGLVAALHQVHAGGVLHRDIKPGNVLVESRAQRVVLTDFGIAAIQDAKALTMVGMLVGSPDYMAPERISGRPQGPPSDIWSSARPSARRSPAAPRSPATPPSRPCTRCSTRSPNCRPRRARCGRYWPRSWRRSRRSGRGLRRWRRR